MKPRNILSLFVAIALAGCVSTMPVVGPMLTPGWDKATLSSNWRGANAGGRMMNVLSPYFSDGKVKDYLAWQKGRGCNTVHLFICNNKDGEGGGYSIYGNGIDWQIDNGWLDKAKARIKQCRSEGFAVVLWGMADDDGGWNKQILSNPEKYMADIKAAGLLDYCSTFVLGLEMTEWGASVGQITRYRDAVRAVYKGKIGTHHNSERVDYAGLGDVLMYQTSPGKSAAQIAALTKKALATGKPVNFFELDRHENRALSEAALKAGAFAVGNW